MFRSFLLACSVFMAVLAQGQFGPEQVIAPLDFKNAYDAELVDVDNDSLLDAVISENYPGYDRIGWYKNLGSGVFGPRMTISTAADIPYDLMPADVNGDGFVDMVSAPRGENTFFWFENNGDQTWPDHSFGYHYNPWFLLTWTVGDLDMDNDPDLAYVVKRYSFPDTVIVGQYRNDGAGNFSGSETLLQYAYWDSLYEVERMAIADLNMDGINDIVFVGDSLVWAEGAGNNEFGTLHNVSIDPHGSTTLTIEDITGDEVPDILLGSYVSGSNSRLQILRNDGNGVFDLAYSWNGSSPILNIGVADMNGDNTADLLLRYDNGGNLEYNGTTMWRAVTTSPFFQVSNSYELMAPHTAQVGADWGDVDDNGICDVLMAGGKQVVWYQQFAQDTAVGHHFSCIPSANVAIADMDGDGVGDLISGGAGIYKGLGGGQFDTQSWLTGVPEEELFTIADLDDDNDLDMVRSGFLLAAGQIMLNDGSGHLTYSCTLPQAYTNDYPGHPSVADIDGDGDLDVVLPLSGVTTAIAWYENLGNGQFGPALTVQLEELYYIINITRVGDMDGDGDVDVLSRILNGQNIFILNRNDGQGVFAPAEIVLPSPTSGNWDIADVDHDGDIDLVVPYYTNDSVRWFSNDGSGAFEPQQAFAFNNPRTVVLGDLDGDTWQELIVIGDQELIGRVYRLNSDTVFTFAYDILEPLNAIYGASVVDQVVPTDVDGDGYTDLLLGRLGLDRISWLHGAACSTFEASVWWAGPDLLQVTEGLAYQWFLNGDIIAGADQPFVTTIEPGEYTASVMNDHGCTDLSTPYQVIVLATNDREALSYHIAPDPSAGDALLFSPHILDAGTRIEMLDMNGRLVRTLRGNGQREITIPRRELPPGMYTIRLIAGHACVDTLRIVFE